jgi:hypothetical protein
MLQSFVGGFDVNGPVSPLKPPYPGSAPSRSVQSKVILSLIQFSGLL